MTQLTRSLERFSLSVSNIQQVLRFLPILVIILTAFIILVLVIFPLTLSNIAFSKEYFYSTDTAAHDLLC